MAKRDSKRTLAPDVKRFYERQCGYEVRIEREREYKNYQGWEVSIKSGDTELLIGRVWQRSSCDWCFNLNQTTDPLEHDLPNKPTAVTCLLMAYRKREEENRGDGHE